MGWKASCVLASPRSDGYLGSYPPHQSEKAKRLLELLGGAYKNTGMTTFEEGIFPQDERLYIGAFDEAIIVGSNDIVDNSFTGGVPWIVDHIRALLPEARVLMITLHSVVDLFGYVLFENGQFVRGCAGSANDGVFFDQGERLPQERKLFGRPAGEDVVMELCRPFLGCRLDQYSLWDLQMEAFERVW